MVLKKQKCIQWNKFKKDFFSFSAKNKKKMKEILNEQLCISNPGVLVSNKHTKQKENRDNVSNYGKNTHDIKMHLQYNSLNRLFAIWNYKNVNTWWN